MSAEMLAAIAQVYAHTYAAHVSRGDGASHAQTCARSAVDDFLITARNISKR